MKNTERYRLVQTLVRRMCGGLPIHFNNDLFADKRQNQFRAESMAFLLKERSPALNTEETLKLYFQVSAAPPSHPAQSPQIYSIEMTLETLGVLAATIANFGVCPLTGDRVFRDDDVRDLMAQMYTSGELAGAAHSPLTATQAWILPAAPLRSRSASRPSRRWRALCWPWCRACWAWSRWRRRPMLCATSPLWTFSASLPSHSPLEPPPPRARRAQTSLCLQRRDLRSSHACRPQQRFDPQFAQPLVNSQLLASWLDILGHVRCFH